MPIYSDGLRREGRISGGGEKKMKGNKRNERLHARQANELEKTTSPSYPAVLSRNSSMASELPFSTALKLLQERRNVAAHHTAATSLGAKLDWLSTQFSNRPITWQLLCASRHVNVVKTAECQNSGRGRIHATSQRRNNFSGLQRTVRKRERKRIQRAPDACRKMP